MNPIRPLAAQPVQFSAIQPRQAAISTVSADTVQFSGSDSGKGKKAGGILLSLLGLASLGFGLKTPATVVWEDGISGASYAFNDMEERSAETGKELSIMEEIPGNPEQDREARVDLVSGQAYDILSAIGADYLTTTAESQTSPSGYPDETTLDEAVGEQLSRISREDPERFAAYLEKARSIDNARDGKAFYNEVVKDVLNDVPLTEDAKIELARAEYEFFESSSLDDLPPPGVTWGALALGLGLLVGGRGLANQTGQDRRYPSQRPIGRPPGGTGRPPGLPDDLPPPPEPEVIEKQEAPPSISDESRPGNSLL